MHKIYIEKFLAIQQAEFEIDKMLLLIGEQASGKSTVSKLTYFFKSLRQDLLLVSYKYITNPETQDLNAQEFRITFWHEVSAKFLKYFGSTKHLPDFIIRYSYSEHKNVTLSLHQNKKLKIEFSADLFDGIFKGKFFNLIQRAIKQRLAQESDILEQINFASSVKEIEYYVNATFEDNRLPHFIPANRNITVAFPDQLKLLFFGSLSGDITALEKDLVEQLAKDGDIVSSSSSVDLYLISEFIKYTEKIKERFRNKDFAGLIDNAVDPKQNEERLLLNCSLKKITQILRAEYRLDRYGEKLYYSEKDYVDLNDASSGQQESIRILQDLFLIILDRTPAFRVIEEPEAHLYPMAQKRLIELMAIMLNHTDSQVIITTHSPYILSIFNNLLYTTHVVAANSRLEQEIKQIIPKACWLNPKTFNAYLLKDGFCRSIVDKELGLIGQNFLDEISEDLGDEFEKMYELHAKVYA